MCLTRGQTSPEQARTPGRIRLRDNMKKQPNPESGKIGWIFLWLIGVPVPILLILFLVRGCT